MKKSYMLMGDPLPLSRMKGTRAVWSDVATQRFAWQLQVDEQQGENPMFSRPFSLEVTFYFSPQTKQYTERLMGKYYENRPSLEELMHGLLRILEGRVYKPNCIIVSIHARKKYDRVARTEWICVQVE